MISTSKLLVLCLTLGVALLAAGCPTRRTVAEIERNPGRYNNKDVTIVGVVRNSYGVSLPGTRMRGGIYEVDDGTGTIWVVTDERSVPNKGAEIAVSGTVGSGISWGGKNYGLGLHEKHRHFGRR
jgi:hypothetical protein